MITEQQKADRNKGVGGSDIPIILGLSSFMTPYELYLEKIGEGKVHEETELQYWGNRLEPIVRQEFEKRSGLDVEMRDTIVHPFFDFMRGNIDGFIPSENAILEVKCASSFMTNQYGEEGTDSLPIRHVAQVAYYCAIMNADSAYIAVLIGGNQYKQFKYVRNQALELNLIDTAKDFWERVQSRTPPEPVNLDDLRLMYPQEEPLAAVISDDRINKKLSALADVKSKSKALVELENDYKFAIMQYMKLAECLTNASGQVLCTWKANKKGSRTFLLKGL